MLLPKFLSFLFRFFFKFIFRERGKDGEREEEKHPCVVASCAPPIGDLAHNPGTCPDWESNWQPFGSLAGTHFTEPHQPGLRSFFFLQTNMSHDILRPPCTYCSQLSNTQQCVSSPLKTARVSECDFIIGISESF